MFLTQTVSYQLHLEVVFLLLSSSSDGDVNQTDPCNQSLSAGHVKRLLKFESGFPTYSFLSVSAGQPNITIAVEWP